MMVRTEARTVAEVVDRIGGDTPPRALLDIFDRVNSGASLTRQQMRNALYYGPGTEWLARMASEESFIQATGGTLSAKKMRDREVINRFAAFHVLGYESYAGGDMDGFLARAIERLNHEERGLDALTEAFIRSMRGNHDLFGGHAFRKSLAEREGAARRTPAVHHRTPPRCDQHSRCPSTRCNSTA